MQSYEAFLLSSMSRSSKVNLPCLHGMKIVGLVCCTLFAAYFWLVSQGSLGSTSIRLPLAVPAEVTAQRVVEPTRDPFSKGENGSCDARVLHPKWSNRSRSSNEDRGNAYPQYAKKGLLFYIDESFGSKALTHCFFQILHAKKHCNEMGCTYNVHEVGRANDFDSTFAGVLADIALLEGFKNHRNRVLAVAEADFVVLDLLPTLSKAMPSDLDSFGCDDRLGGTAHEARMEDAAKRIPAAPYWAEPQKVLMPLSYPVGSKRLLGILGRPLLDLVKAPIITTTTSDHIYSSHVTALCRRAVVVPSLPDPFLYSKDGITVSSIEERTFDIFYDEPVLKVYVREGIGLLATALRQLSLPIRINFSFRHTVVDESVLRAEQMARSKLCLLSPNADGHLAKARVVDSLGKSGS